MANKQINQLTNLPAMADDDLLLVYDIDGAGSEKTKNMTYSQFHDQISGTVGGGGGSYTHISEPGTELLLGDQAETNGSAIRLDSAGGITVTVSGNTMMNMNGPGGGGYDPEIYTHAIFNMEQGSLSLGKYNTRAGSMTFQGNGTGSPRGGRIWMRMAEDFLGSTYYYAIWVDEDDLIIGPYQAEDSLKYNRANAQWEFNEAAGVSGTFYGDGSNLTGVGGGYSYISEPGDDILIGDQAETNGAAIRVDSAEGIITTTISGNTGLTMSTVQGDGIKIETSAYRVIHAGRAGAADVEMYLGKANTRRGTLRILGAGAGQDIGAQLYINLANDHTNPNYYYTITTFEDDLRIGPYGDSDSLTYDYGNSIWEFTAGAVKITGMPAGATQGASGAAVGQLWRTSGHGSLPNGVVMIGI